MVDASEAAKTRADELDVNIEEVEGTGSGGNVKVSDVEAFAEDPGEAQALPEELVEVILNPETGLRAYGFDAEFSPVDKQSYLLTQGQYEEYGKQTLQDGFGVKRKIIVKA